MSTSSVMSESGGDRRGGAVIGCVILVIAALTPPHADAAFVRPADPWPGPAGEFVFVEAEDFELDGQGWRVIADSGRRADPAASGGKALSGAERTDGLARAAISVPQTGPHHLWVRFAQFPRPNPADRGPFRLAVRQGGKVVVELTLDDRYDGPARAGRPAAIPPFTWRHEKVDLRAGPAAIELAKAGSGRVSNHLRQVDCLVLTTDPDYTADHRDWGPQTYLRIRLAQAQPERVYFQAMFNHMRAPFYNRATFDRTGATLRAVRSGPQNAISPGEATPWMNITRLLDSGLDANLSLGAIAASEGTPDGEVTRSGYALDFATSPAEDKVVKSIRRDGPGFGIHVRVGPHLSPDTLPRSDLEIAGETRALVDALPPVTFGRRPTRFPVMTDWSASDRTHTPGTQAIELEVMRYLGINAKANPPLEQADVEAGILFSRVRPAVWFQGPGGYNDPKTDIMNRQVAARAQVFQADPYRDRYVHAKVMDEATATPLDRLASNPTNQAAFQAWVRDRGMTPADLGVTSWDQVRIVPDQGDAPPGLYVASQRFRAAGVADFFALATRVVHEHFGPDIKVTQNFSDGAVYMANMYAQGNDYYVWFKRRSLDMAMSEDWTALGSTPQCCGWNVALLRSATRYHGQPIAMYVISYGPYLDTKRRAYSDIAQGAKQLNFYAYGPLYQGHEPGWCRKPGTFQAVAELTREVGAAEHVLLDAMPRPAATAIIYSVSSDIWTVRRDNAMGHERMHTYIALRHGQVAVDVLSEDDVIEGRLQGYRTAYLFGDQLDQRACRPLAEWVGAGGSLVLAAGAGGRDELNRPSALLDEQLGIRRGGVRTMQTMWHYGRAIPKVLKPQGKVKLEGRSRAVDLLARQQPLTAGSGATVLARFEDMSPASIRQPVGAGQVRMDGFLPAIAYVCEALAAMEEPGQSPVAPESSAEGGAPAAEVPGVEGSMQQETQTMAADRQSIAPSAFDPALGSFILQDAISTDRVEPVVVNAPLVEATLLEGEAGWVVTLANFDDRALPAIQVTVRVGDRRFGQVRSSRMGLLSDTDPSEGVARVSLPLDSTDMVFAQWDRP